MSLSGNDSRVAALDTLLPLGVLSLSFAAAYVLRSCKFPYLHESGASILIGGIVGCIFQFLVSDAKLRASLVFDANFFMVVLLPPIIFESGYSLKKRIFFSNLGSILTFAFLGTVVTAAAFGLLTYLVTLTGLTSPLTFLECFIFGSIISATDPVTTLSLFKELNVEHDLYSNVFGESVLNDAVAIALFRVTSGFLDREFTTGNILVATGEFGLIFCGSLLIGAVIGLFSALLFKWTDLQRWPQMELAVMAVLAWTSFLLSEALHLSGIVAILFAGMFMAHYTQPNLSLQVQDLVGNFFGTFAFIAETFVFTSLGLTIFFVQAKYDWPLVIACMANCALARAAEVFPLSAIINYFRSTSHRLDMNSQIMLWYAGLRGAIAFSLALTVTSPHHDAILTSTLMIVLLSVICLGAGTKPMLSLLKIRLHVPDPPPNTTSSAHIAFFEWFDRTYFRSLFRKGAASPISLPPASSTGSASDIRPILSSGSISDEENAKL